MLNMLNFSLKIMLLINIMLKKM